MSAPRYRGHRLAGHRPTSLPTPPTASGWDWQWYLVMGALAGVPIGLLLNIYIAVLRLS